jgi:hypothetical protein
MLLSPIVTGHCQGQLLLLWQNPVPLRLRGYHPLSQHVPEHFSSENSILYAIAHHISTTLPWQIQFGLFRFRSPLLAESRLISLPRPTQMLHFGQFALPSEKQGSVKRDLIRKSWDHRSRAPTPGLSQLATSFITYQAESFPNRRLCTITGPSPCSITIAAPEILREHFRKATFFLNHLSLDIWRVSVILCTTVIADLRLLRPSSPIFIGDCTIWPHEHHSDPLHRVVRTANLGGDPAAGSPTTTLLRLLPRC